MGQLSLDTLGENSNHMDFYVTLNNGTKMPRLGLGTWKAPAEKTKEAVITAVKAGYRLIDCANDYDNEHVIGEALQELFAAGVVKREDLFIQAKLWNSNHRAEHVKPDIRLAIVYTLILFITATGVSAIVTTIIS